MENTIQPEGIKRLLNGNIDYDFYSVAPKIALGISKLAFQKGLITDNEFSETMYQLLIEFKSNYQN